ncbi:leucine-rich repeats and immunoglobulin-like domains protein 1 [Saccostrea echinata]|uniref:leucine-rich repeats and immunoglobulin-like domains protein 1 n=1 Tax=Saccostrea echinata TaxID=191078 RepID=UPI002A83BDB1|nr:leucine-rich repeats and immunoglobulin-like domains protein 1 [Saccostrea echinata]
MAVLAKRTISMFTFFLVLNQRLAASSEICQSLCSCVIFSNRNNVSAEVIEINCQGNDLELFPNLTEYKGTQIQRLNLGNNSFFKLTVSSVLFDGAIIQELNLDNNRFLEIENNAFSNIKELKKLTLNNCGLESADLIFVRNIPNLLFLALRSNKIKELKDSSVFEGSPLEELDLSYNPNINIHEEVLKVLASTLIFLYMDYTNVDISNLQFLGGLANLKLLSMEGARSSKYNSIQQKAFGNLSLSSLESLTLSKSGLKVVFPKAFDGLDRLKYLDLSGNELNNQVFGVTGTKPSLQVLKLSYNPSIQSILKIPNKNLTELHMEGTGVNLISYDAFSVIGDSLVILNLRSCQLPPEGMFLVDAFRPLRSLRKLDLSYNYLKEIFNETFDDMNKLEELDLSGNIMKFSKTDFSGLEESLKTLRLRNMTLQTLPVEALASLENLQELDASFNNFTNISKDFFGSLSVRTLNLTSCNIFEIHKEAFIRFNKTNVILDGNNITSVDFLSFLSHNTFGTLTMRNNNINCSRLNQVHVVVFDNLEGYCVTGNHSEPLSAYLTKKLNMKAINSCCKTETSQLVIFTILAIRTFIEQVFV